jgi:hypothetical protein
MSLKPHILIELYLLISAIGLTMCSNNAPVKLTSTPNIINTSPMETPTSRPLKLPTRTENSRNPTKDINKATATPLVVDTYKPTSITIPIAASTPSCPAWVYEKQKYSKIQWENMPGSRKPSDYIGFQFHNLPPTITFNGSSSMYIWDYSLSWIRENGIEMLWLEKYLCTYLSDSFWEVIDVLELPAISKKDMLVLGTLRECSINGIADPELIVIAQIEITGYLDKIKEAWRANLVTKHIEKIPTAGITCNVVISE